MNQVIVAGRLGRDADLKPRSGDSTRGNGSVCNFSVAVDVGFGDKKKTLWIACAIWGERAEKLAPYLTKGTAVTVVGDFDLRQYEKKDKTAGAEITCNVQRITLQGGGERRDQDPPQTVAEKSKGAAPDADFDDKLPF